jgi:hypothetical protein
MEVHGCARLHIGCDEVWCLGQSPLTAAFMEARGLSLTDIFLRHVTAVARFVKDTPPHPQVWRLIRNLDEGCGSGSVRICTVLMWVTELAGSGSVWIRIQNRIKVFNLLP